MNDMKAWVLSLALLGGVCTPPLSALPTFQGRNEQEALIRRAERLQRQMEKMKARYQKEGKKEYVALLEEGLRWMDESQLIRKMNETSLAISSKERRSIQAAKKVLQDIDKLLSILLDRRSIEDLEKETRDVEKNLQTLKRLQKKQEELRKAMKKIDEASKTKAEAEISRDLMDLAQREREEARKNAARAGSLQKFLEQAMDEVQGMQKENEKLEKRLGQDSNEANPELGEKVSELFRKTQKEIASLEVGRSLEKALKELSLQPKVSPKKPARSWSSFQRRMADLEETFPEGLSGELKKRWEALKAAIGRQNPSPETRNKLRKFLKDFDREARDNRRDIARQAEGLAAETKKERSRRALKKAAEHLRKSAQDVSKKESLLQTGKALQDLMDAIAASSPPPPEEMAQDLKQRAERLANGLETQKGREPRLDSELEEAVQALKKAAKAASRIAERRRGTAPKPKEGRPGEISKALARTKASLDRSLAALKERIAGKAREGARDQANLEKQLERIAKKVEQARRQGDLSAEQAESAKQGLQKAKSEMNKAASHLKDASPNKASLNQGRAARDLEKAARDLARKRKVGEKGRAEMNRLAKKQEELEEEILRLAQRVDPRKNQRARKALEEAAESARKARQAMRSGQMNQSRREQEKASKKLEEARKNLQKERDQYWRLRQEELLFQIGEEVGVLIMKQKEISRKTLDLAGEAANAERLPRRLRTRIRALGRAEKELEVRSRFLADNLEKENTLVFTFVLESIADDLGEIARIFTARRPSVDAFVQGLQAEVLGRLKMLKDSLEEEQKKKKQRQKQNQGKPNSNEGDQKPKLVPDVAELRMLKRLELSTKQRIDTFLHLQETLPGGLGELQTDALKRLALRHAKVSDLFRTFLKSRGLLEEPKVAEGRKGKDPSQGKEKK